MPNYLEPTDEDAFVDWPAILEQPSYLKNSQLCPVCKGHGGWNLSINAYPLHNNADTPENRHRFSHFLAHCVQCNGYGWTDDVDCIHEYARTKNVGRCLNEHECVKCHKKITVDSSD